MARDYKQKHYAPKQAYKRQSQQVEEPVGKGISAKWVFVVALLMTLGLLLGFYVVQHFAQHGVKSNEKPSMQLSETTEKMKQVLATPQKAEAPVVKKPVFEASVNHLAAEPHQSIKYSFYKGLAKTEVIVDAEPISVELPVPYYIQAGTFNEMSRAQKEHQRLRQFGFDLQLSTITWKGKMYYRLRLGPFTNRLEMNKTRNQLHKLGVDTLLIRGKKPDAEKDAQAEQQTAEAAP